MPDQFPVFEAVLKQRGRGWTWRICKATGDVIMDDSELSRSAAQYIAYRSLFLMLRSAPYQLMRPSIPKGARLPALGRESFSRRFRERQANENLSFEQSEGPGWTGRRWPRAGRPGRLAGWARELSATFPAAMLRLASVHKIEDSTQNCEVAYKRIPRTVPIFSGRAPSF
jgi:hypothetical protein